MRWFAWKRRPGYSYIITGQDGYNLYVITPEGEVPLPIERYDYCIKKGEYKEYNFNTYIKLVKQLNKQL